MEILNSEGERETVFGPDQKGSGFIHEFDVSDEKEGEQGVFTIVISCKDQDDLESEMIYKIRITHNPTDPKRTLLGTEWGIPLSGLAYIFPVLFLLMIGAHIFLFVMIQNKNNKDKENKMALLEKKRKEDEKAKASTAIEEEFTGGRTRDSREYLKKSGGEKGKEDFAKELEAAEKRGEVREGTLDQKAPAPPLPQAGATVPPKPSVKPQSVRIARLGGGKATVLAAYKRVLDKAWADKVLTGDEEAILSQLRKVLGVTMAEHLELKDQKIDQQNQVLSELIVRNPQSRRENMLNNIRRVAMSDGQITPDEQVMLDELKDILGLSGGPAPGQVSVAQTPPPQQQAPPTPTPPPQQAPPTPPIPTPPPIPQVKKPPQQ
jgi:hypothetical protein